jgi:hypothetical protein
MPFGGIYVGPAHAEHDAYRPSIRLNALGHVGTDEGGHLRKRATMLAMVVAGAIFMGQQDPCATANEGLEDTGLEDSGGGDTEPKRSPQRTRRFSGNGSKNVGTVKVTDDAVLKWTNTGSEYGPGMFAVYDKDFKINVSSQGKRGQSALEPGTYRSIDVTGDDWTMTIKGR